VNTGASACQGLPAMSSDDLWEPFSRSSGLVRSSTRT